MEGVRVSLSSGDVFYIDADLPEVAAFVTRETWPCLIRVGGRLVNPEHITQLTAERDIPSIHTPETLQEVPA